MKLDGEAFSPGFVVLVPFPYTDQSGSKRRPAVVVSSEAYNLARPDIVLMPVTSQLRASLAFGEVWIEDWQHAGLLKPSAVKPVLATFEQSLVLHVLGKLSDVDGNALADTLRAIVGFR